ncbi:MAG TPA: DNA-formamidopyrimidine glycosylase family protein [Chryseosolibacter sp.]
MPELPDLQVFSTNLTKALKNKKLLSISVKNQKKLATPVKTLKAALEGQTLSVVRREGKELYFQFKNKAVLGLHLMLRGKLTWFEDKNDQKFTIVELVFQGGKGLAVSDYQGQAAITLNPSVKESPDALSADVNYPFLKEKLNRSKASVKNVLLDQKFIRGIGNAYADEILWAAGISPFSISSKIPDAKIKALAKSIVSVLEKAEKTIRKNHPDIITGEVRDFLSVHNSKRETTSKGEKILVEASGARKTYYTAEQELFD